MTIKEKVGIIRRMAGNSEYVKTISGAPPLTLTKTLAKAPKSITVYGASGGVGDATTNLLNPEFLNKQLDGNMVQVGNYNLGQREIQVKANTNYTLWTNYTENDITGIAAPISLNNVANRTSASTNGVWQGQTRTFMSTSEGKLWIFSSGFLNTDGTYFQRAVAAGYKFMLVEGEYTYETFPAFEGYGYKIPLSTSINLPSGYTRFYSIRGSGNSYIDTGFKPNQDTKVEINFKLYDGTGYIFGSRESVNSNGFTVQAFSAGKFGGMYGDTSRAFTNAPIDNDRHTFVLDGKTQNFSIDGIVYTENDGTHSYPASEFKCKGNALLFHINGASAGGIVNGLLYWCKIYDNNKIARYFIPAKRNRDNVIGLYDVVKNVFYTNAGSGSFSAASEMSTGMPDKTMNLYSDAQLGSGDTLTVTPGASAIRESNGTSKVVTYWQDWDQDFTLSKVDSLSIAAGTTVAPSSIRIQYYSKK